MSLLAKILNILGPMLFEFIWGKIHSFIEKLKAKKEAEEKAKDAEKSAENSDDTSGNFGNK